MEKKLKKFQPITPTARTLVEDLLKRGGLLVKETREYVEVSRHESIAHIDQMGRVEWRAR
jgi:hypothetical protein